MLNEPDRKYLGASAAAMFAIAVTATAAPDAGAAVVRVTGGSASMDLDRIVWGSLNFGATTSQGLFDPSQYVPGVVDPGLYLEEFFDQATAAIVPPAQGNSFQIVPGFGEIPSTGLVYGVNGASVTNLPGLHAQPTNFSFDPSNPAATAVGAIGLGGTMRFRGTWAAPNYASSFFAMGEFTLEYQAGAAVRGASGWILKNHVSFPSDTFDLFNVTTEVERGSFSLSGDLRFTPSSVSAFFAAEDAGKDLGDFHLTVTTVPVPAAIWFLLPACGGLGMVARRKRST